MSMSMLMLIFHSPYSGFVQNYNNNGALNDRLYLDKENSTKRVNSKQQMKHRGQHIFDAV